MVKKFETNKNKNGLTTMDTMGGLFAADPIPLSVEDCVAIYQKSYK